MKRLVTEINQCIDLYSRKQYQNVINRLPQLLKKIPYNEQLLYILARSERYVGNHSNSEHYFKILLEKSPKNCAFLCGYANLLMSIKHINKSKHLFEKALTFDANYFDANYNLARLLSAQSNFTEAQKYYTKAVAIQPSHQSANIGLIDCQNEIFGTNEAIKTCLKFIQDYQENKLIKQKLALLYKDIREVECCVDTFNELISDFPNELEIKRSFTLCLVTLGLYYEAEDALKTLLMQLPNDFELHESYFYSRWNLGKSDYFTYYDKLINKITNPDILYSFCKKLIKEDSLNKALEVVEYTFVLNINTYNAYLIKGHVLRELGQFEQSLAILLEGKKYYPDSVDLLYELVVTNLCLKRYESAITLSKGMTEKFKWHQGCWALYSTCLRYNGKESEYKNLYDYDHFVKIYSLPLPDRYDNITAYNTDLLKTLESYHNSNRHPIEQSIRNGQQTPNHLFSNTHEVFKELELALNKVVRQYLKDFNETKSHPLLANVKKGYFFSGAWSINMKKQGYHKNHYHHKGWISGPYYVVVPDAVNEGGEGWLKLGQPELSRWLEQEAEYYIKPAPGDVILFPSYMWHGTVPLTKDQQRVTVSFDITPYDNCY